MPFTVDIQMKRLDISRPYTCLAKKSPSLSQLIPFPLRFVQNTTQREKVLSQFLQQPFISCQVTAFFQFLQDRKSKKAVIDLSPFNANTHA